MEIKKLLYEDLFTIAGAKKCLTGINREGGRSPYGDERLVEIKKGLREIRDMIS
jgi:hypothetical protein